MEYEPFETLARLYLEESGYITSTDVPIPQKNGGGDVDVFALHPNQNGAIIGFCTTNTYGIPVRKWKQRMQKQRRFILEKYPSLNGNLEFWYFTLWMGKNEKRKRARLEKLGFQNVVGPKDLRKFLHKLIRDYCRAWEWEQKTGPREKEPVRWTVKALCRLGLLKRRRRKRGKRRHVVR